MQDPDLIKRAHMIVSYNLFRRDRNGQTISTQLNIAELAGSEQGLSS